MSLSHPNAQYPSPYQHPLQFQHPVQFQQQQQLHSQQQAFHPQHPSMGGMGNSPHTAPLNTNNKGNMGPPPAHAPAADCVCPGIAAERVHVWDPDNKKEYVMQYTDFGVQNSQLRPEERTQVFANEGLKLYQQNVSTPGPHQKKFFLCKQYQAGKCRRYQDCLSMHVDRELVKDLRKRFPIDKLMSTMVRARSAEDDGEEFNVEYRHLAQAGAGGDGVWVVAVSPRDAPLSHLLSRRR